MKAYFDIFLKDVVALLTNRVLIAAAIAWIMAQIIKNFTCPKDRRDRSFLRFIIGSGGMPSSHTAVVCTACFSCGFLYGFGSPLFAISAVLAVVVMRDAAGIRNEAGKQAKAINAVTNELSKKHEKFAEFTLSEWLGHTPLQVFFGALLGILTAVVCQFWLFDLWRFPIA